MSQLALHATLNPNDPLGDLLLVVQDTGTGELTLLAEIPNTGCSASALYLYLFPPETGTERGN